MGGTPMALTKAAKDALKAKFDALSKDEQDAVRELLGEGASGDILATIEAMQKDILELKKTKEPTPELSFFDRLFGR